MTLGGREIDVGGEGSNYQNNTLDHPFKHSISKLLILTGKKLAFKFSTYMLRTNCKLDQFVNGPPVYKLVGPLSVIQSEVVPFIKPGRTV